MITLTHKKYYRYPYVGENVNTHCLMLFTSKKNGIHLHKSEEGYYMGKAAKDYSEHEFRVCTTPIPICNKPLIPPAQKEMT